MFIVVMVQLCRIKRQNPHNVQNRSGFQDLRSVAGLTVLLGLTWGFAFFAWGPVNLAFMYLFAIFNSLQGKLITSSHCNSPALHTATQKTKKSSVNRIGSSSVKSSNSNNLSSSTTFLVSNSPGSGSRSGSERSLGISECHRVSTICSSHYTYHHTYTDH
uniref:G-protein coupled receptors family 2 profile 2 domain-containing protein n=1 Tax=Astyanax mexicanus TaxID=7994 RepID=A0A3B1J7E8_ASTMX